MPARPEEVRPEKLRYVAPQLTVYGSIQRLTEDETKPGGRGDVYRLTTLSPF